MPFELRNAGSCSKCHSILQIEQKLYCPVQLKTFELIKDGLNCKDDLGSPTILVLLPSLAVFGLKGLPLRLTAGVNHLVDDGVDCRVVDRVDCMGVCCVDGRVNQRVDMVEFENVH